jgi:hypothetical protein
MFELLDTCMYQLKYVTATMWGLFELLYKTIKTSGMDYLEEVLPALDNYVSYGASTVSTTPVLQEMFFDLVQTVRFGHPSRN